MAAPESSCRRWFQKNFVDATPCRKCFEPSGGPCMDYTVSQPPSGEVEPQANIIQATIEPDGPVRQQIDIRAECSKARPLLGSDKDKLRCCTMCVAQEQDLKPNLCSAACRPLETSLHLDEWTKRPRPKPTYKHSVILDNNTIAGRCFPIKFQLKRMKNKCLDCGKDLYFRYPIANNTDVLLLQNCCDVEVYPAKKVEEMNNVKVAKITGAKKIAKSLLKERSECHMFKVPPPEPPIVVTESPVLSKRKSAKRKSKKGKGKKGKKGKK
ncbi:hypothetical protein KR054_006055 [Drosophila jambulina]|nr:hypothetical protein KR054_006055 [Drosophila jambulina]